MSGNVSGIYFHFIFIDNVLEKEFDSNHFILIDNVFCKMNLKIQVIIIKKK